MSELQPDRPPTAPLTFDVTYPDRALNRLTSALRIFTIIPIAIVLSSIVGYSTSWQHADESSTIAISGAGLLFFPPLLMLVFRGKYPRWWFDFNRELLGFTARVGAYATLLTDRYPATDEEQDVHLHLPEPDPTQLSRVLPIIKWFLVIPHYIVLFFLSIGVVIAVVIAWFAILFTGRYPRGLYNYVVGVGRWELRVVAYAFALVTDEYPPFRLAP
ncbi:MAG TPA: DUF4389 domain-containing protein [Baekduia sp.]|nr:DUF4389 domain-containing protein [Baekduia sp.]